MTGDTREMLKAEGGPWSNVFGQYSRQSWFSCWLPSPSWDWQNIVQKVRILRLRGSLLWD